MTPWGGLSLHRASTASTMDDAQGLEDEGAPDGSLVRADYQSAGRGRHGGRTWASDPGLNLLFTVFWKPDRFAVPAFAPSLTVGLGVCLWLETLGLPSQVPIRLKWPNDVYLGPGKLAGILVRRRWGASGPRSVHAGLGINLVTPAQSEGFRTPPASLAQHGLSLTPAQALEGLLPALARALELPDPRAQCEARLWRRGEAVELNLPDASGAGQGPVRGRVLGLDDQGRLLFEGPRGPEALSSGE